MRARIFGRKLVAAVALALGLQLGGASPANAQVQTAVEYYYAAWNFYFFTAFPDEIAALDGGAFGGVWQRTGQTFSVWSDASRGGLPTCRFFSVTFAPKSSHFYTPNAAECAGLMSNPNWEFESIAFYLQLPDASGNCPLGTLILYRLYDNGMGGAPNHRFTTSLATFNQMLAAGWILEGDLRTHAFACVPLPATAEGLWAGSTNTGALLLGIVLDDATFYIVYVTPAQIGLIQGNATYSNGQFTSSNAIDINFTGLGVTSSSISGSFVPQSSLNGMITLASQPATFSATYDPDYWEPASLAEAAGSYSGYAATSASTIFANFTLGADGAFSGTSPGCSFAGRITPRGSVNVFDLSVTFQGGMCSFGTSTLTGIAFYDVGSNELLAMAPNAARTDGFVAIGTRQ